MKSRSLLAAPIPASSPMPAVLAKGFRPFFLLASMYAALSLPLWLLALSGRATIGAHFGAPFWHAHEMVFGFAVAVIAGFLLTAAGNWTGHETAKGATLALLSALWIAGRVAVLAGDWLPPRGVAVVDLAFLPALALSLAVPMSRAKSRRNYVFLALLAALFAANLSMHVALLGGPATLLRRASTVSVEIIVLMIVVITGRVVPMFTRNATHRDDIRSLPLLEKAAILAMVAIVLGDTFGVDESWMGRVAALAGVLVIARARHWGTRHTLGHPLAWILHLACAFVAFGLLARFASQYIPALAASTALHALTAGGIGLSTLGMMARVSLGHSGRMLVASRTTTVAFALVTTAAVLRVVGPVFGSSAYLPFMIASGLLFAGGFAVFSWAYGPMLVTPRVDGKPG